MAWLVAGRNCGAVLLAATVATLALGANAAAAAGPPQIGAGWVTDVTASSANLHAQINPEGLATNYRFEYLTEAALVANQVAGREEFSGAISVPAAGGSAGSGSAPQGLVQRLEALTPSTVYRYRVLAGNSSGSASGPIRRLETQESAPVFHLADGRGWELVSPVDKNGGAVQGPGANFGGDDLQAAAQGGALTYSSASSFGAEAQGSPAASQYLGGREAGGWSADNITAPQRSGAEPQAGAGVPYRVFSEDLSTALLFSGGDCLGHGEGCANPTPPLAPGAPNGYQNYYLRDSAGGAYRALITAADAPALSLPAEAFEVRLAGAGPDLGHVVLQTCARLTLPATEVAAGSGCDPAAANLYEWGGGTLSLLNLLPGDAAGTPGALLAASSGAISTDGSRVYFTAGGNLYLREGNRTAEVDGAQGGGTFQTASADGSAAFFTRAGHLYRYDAASEASVDLSPGGEVRGVLGASANGSSVYFETEAGLFLWRQGLGARRIAAEADPGNYPPATGEARVSADGRLLAFASSAELAGFDNTDAGTGKADAELYLYDAVTAGLSCISCNPTGERPTGPASLPGALSNGEGPLATRLYKPRALAANGSRLFFDSDDSLSLRDTNGRPDVYEWEAAGSGDCAKAGGCVSLISSGRDLEPAEFIDASADGADVFFLTAASLVPTDPGAYDLYDAREGGGFTIAPTPIPCDGDACQPLPSPPEDPTPGTLVPAQGNPGLHFAKAPKKKGHHKKKRGHRRKRHHHKKPPSGKRNHRHQRGHR